MTISSNPKERYFTKKRILKKTQKKPTSLVDVQKARSKNLKKASVSSSVKRQTDKEREEASLKFVPKSVREFLTKKHKEEDIKTKKGEQRELPYGEGYLERQLFEKDESLQQPLKRQPSQGSRERGEREEERIREKKEKEEESVRSKEDKRLERNRVQREKRLIAKSEALKKIKKLTKEEEEDISKATKRIRDMEGDRSPIRFRDEDDDRGSAPDVDSDDEYTPSPPKYRPQEPLSLEEVREQWYASARQYKLKVEDLKHFLNKKAILIDLLQFLTTQPPYELAELMRTARISGDVPEGISNFIEALIRKHRNKNVGGNIDFKGGDAVIKKHLRGLAKAGGLGDFIKSALGSVVEAFKENPADFFKKVVSHAKTGLEYGKKGIDFAKQGHSYLKSKFKGGSLQTPNAKDAVIKKHLRGLARAGGLGDFIKSALGSVVEAFKENPADFFKKVVSHAKTGLEYGKKGYDFAKQGHSYLKSKFKGGDISTRQVIPQKLTGTQTKQKLSEMIKKAGVL